MMELEIVVMVLLFAFVDWVALFPSAYFFNQYFDSRGENSLVGGLRDGALVCDLEEGWNVLDSVMVLLLLLL